MEITYFVVRKFFGGKEPGELIPEAADYTFIQSYINDARIAPVLVCTLPQYVQEALAEWKEAKKSDPTLPFTTPEYPSAEAVEEMVAEELPVDVPVESPQTTATKGRIRKPKETVSG